MIFPFLTLLFVVLATSKITVFAFANNETDRLALQSFKASITNDSLGTLHSWNNSIHFCQWNGVTCSSRRQRVTALDLSSQHLVGTLSSHIGNLSFLRVLSLYDNDFHGSIPNEIGRLFRLQVLSLVKNSFQGGLPPNLSHCVDIEVIDLADNHLHGELPSEFSSWTKLQYFSLKENKFAGSIPPSIGNISSLGALDLSQNNLQGHIPFEVAHHTYLEHLNLGTNSLSGMVPLPIYNISSLIFVDLSRNNLEGTLPADLDFTQLQYFLAAENRISGPLPPSLANASNLIIFDIIGNIITGPIPNNFGRLLNIQCLNMGYNPLGGGMLPNDLSFLNSLVNCSHLDSLDFASTGIRGELPNAIVNLSTTIEHISLDENHIYGSIPREIGKLENITKLSLFHNLLTGAIPESIGKLSWLGELNLAENKLSGSIPTCISNVTNQFVRLRLEGNMLNGSIPAELFNISTLEQVSLADNRFEGVIPEKIEVLSHCIHLNLSQNLLSGALPSNIGRLEHLVELDVSNNKLSGDIPASLSRCVMLETLYMGGNSFQGEIPSSFKTLKSLIFLDLSNNNISGDIPIFFDGFRLMNFLNLSHNKLEGKVPETGLFSNASAFSVRGNLELCGGIPALRLHVCRNKNKTISMRIVLLLVFLPLSILLIISFALICYRCRNSRKLCEPVPVLEESPYLRLSYQDLFVATKEFSPKNLLGEGRYGSVYKGVLKSMEHVGMKIIVAVKVLKVEISGANKSFLAECEALRNIRHRNLIRIITTCSSTDFEGNDFKALVFEFMSNGSVDNWLHPSPSHQGNKENLSLLQRLNISIDVGMGLEYLHHHSSPTIIHSDIKPSNILLDEEFVAHIGDFGLAKFTFPTTGDHNQAQMSSTGVRGTIGYVPPEYGMGGEISTKGDVYSYGIFLLEFFSGRRPTECGDGSNLHEYVRNALPYKVMDITDPRILLDQEELGLPANQSYNRAAVELCMGSIFEVGILCSQEMLQKRIDISVAIKHLHMARDKLLQLI
ncbi:putative receptor-like protein kinase At3g47110 [Daucus carota subsp. sativus]|uniref:putative receptor-like protein kinase At3g47110 n=1 Tax=Daucus carota subsp. sativus TaxID=79200 RepID=UPI0007EF11C7|nr:PREDICTED: putative receptor-like protein kinase At3g47110 [Daucus carota subsp. sativus]